MPQYSPVLRRDGPTLNLGPPDNTLLKKKKKDVSGEIEVKKAIHDQVSFWEKAQGEDGQEGRLVVIIIILVGFVVS